MQQKSITDYQIRRAPIQLRKSPELDAGRVLEESMLQIFAVCPHFFLFTGTSAYRPAGERILDLSVSLDCTAMAGFKSFYSFLQKNRHFV